MGGRRLTGSAAAGSGSGPGSAAGRTPAQGERRATIADVAARAGVSKSAVSFVFNGRRGLSEATTARILHAADDLGWRPSVHARALARSRAQSVGLVIRREAPWMHAGSDILAGLDGLGTALAAAGMALVVRVVSSAAQEEEAYAAFARESSVHLVLLGSLRDGDERPALLDRLGLPFVVADRGAAIAEERRGARLAVRHLAGLGHRRIALVAAGAPHPAEAFLRASRDLGVDAVVRRLDGPASASAATADLLASPGRPTAIVYGTALLAAAGMCAAARGGLPVPGDLSVVALDDGPIAALTTPTLTTVRQDAEAEGRAIGLRLTAGADEPVSLPPAELVVRGSTGPPPPG